MTKKEKNILEQIKKLSKKFDLDGAILVGKRTDDGASGSCCIVKDFGAKLRLLYEASIIEAKLRRKVQLEDVEEILGVEQKTNKKRRDYLG